MVFRRCRRAALTVPVVLVKQRDPASKSDREDLWVAQLHTEDVLWSLNDLICIVLMCSQQTVAQRWQWSTLTNTSFNCGEQIVSTFILSNVCLSFIWAAHEKFSDTGAMPEVTSHHIFSSYEADCCSMLRRVTWQNHLCLQTYTCQRPFYMCSVRVCVCQRVRAVTCARLYAFMIMCVQRLMMVQVCKAIFLCSEVK